MPNYLFQLNNDFVTENFGFFFVFSELIIKLTVCKSIFRNSKLIYELLWYQTKIKLTGTDVTYSDHKSISIVIVLSGHRCQVIFAVF